VKPKLVARDPGATSSAWKRAAPAIAADGVPSNLRPVLSYLLWRLHERETYSFVKDSSFLVSDDKETRAIAQKLGIAVKTFQALSSETLVQKKPETDVSNWGDLEREFGKGTKSAPASRNGIAHDVVAIPQNTEVKLDNHSAALPDMEKREILDVVHREEEFGNPQIEVKQQEVKILETTQDGALEPNKSILGGTVTKENIPVTPRVWADVVSNRTRPVPTKVVPPAPKSQTLSLPIDVSVEQPKDTLMDGAAHEKASTIADWVQKVKAAGSEPQPRRSPPSPQRNPKARKAKELTPPTGEPPKPFRPILMQRNPNGLQNGTERVPSPVPTLSTEHRKNGESNHTPSVSISSAHSMAAKAESSNTPPEHRRNGESNHTPSVSISSAHSMAAKAESSNTPPSAKAPSSKGLHDEMPPAKEVPVKEASAKASSRKDSVTDEPEDSDEEVVVFEPRAKRISVQQVPKEATLDRPFILEEQPKPVQLPSIEVPRLAQQEGLKQSSPNRAGPPRNRQQPKPRAPVVIDPDAFGRDFATNPRPNHPIAHSRSQPRPSSQHGPVLPRPIFQNGPPPNSQPPQRPVSQHGPPRGHARGGRYHNGHIPLNNQAAPNGHNGYVPSMVNGHKKPNGYIGNAENGNVTNGNTTNGNATNGINGVNRPVANGSPLQVPQPDTSGIDVDYVLKSGSTRGAPRGRGRGKLFIP